ncbi:MAG: hypothetical protein QOH38_790 [Thermoleophilaceae bacterium]|nr:hypothetical protein [Thermoleophilaceae bacterium]
MSAKPDGTLGGGDSNLGAVSTNGRYVVFASSNSDLTPPGSDTNGTVMDVYRRDLQTGTTELVSKKVGAETSANAQSGPSIDISADGRYVLFSSSASDLGGDTDSQEDVFVRDMVAGTTQLVSVKNGGGGSGNGDNNQAHMTPDGRYVVWSSTSNDISPQDPNGLTDIYRRDLTTNTTQLVSVNTTGTGGSDPGSFGSLITPDGRYVAFFSNATDIASAGTPDTNGMGDIFIRDMTAGTTQYVSLNSTGTAAASGFSSGPFSITPDGRYVSFTSQAADVTAGTDNNSGGFDSYRRDVTGGSTALVSTNLAGTGTGNAVSADVYLSADGRYAAFESDASDLVASGVDANGVRDVYRRDITAGTTKLLSVTDAGGAAGNGASRGPRITPDGRYVAFDSNASDLVGGGVDHNGATTGDVYRRDARSDTTRLISINLDRTAAAIGFAPLLMANGDVLFHSPGSDLTPPGQDSGGSDIFLTRNAAPTGVSFTAMPDTGHVPLAVAFAGSGTDVEGPLTYSWEFGDGAPGSGQNVHHTYAAAGTFTANLTVTDGDGATASTTRTITVAAAVDSRPVVSAFKAVPKRFAVQGRGRKGTTFRYRLSEIAGVRVRIERALPGRRRSGRCVKPTRSLRNKRKCTRYRRAGTLTRSGIAGANRIRFTGKFGTKALKPGRYRATIVATDSAGQLSQARRLTFVVFKR